ncbi:cobalt-precorrin-5B (C(1))-methyltransferase CbiD [Synechococcus sp. PCC 6312]|uniref:cobalt-precorrin-5B (C(1))-methyltransferase CbiD n=1 Tax=Synechococcus sp. (strain ATCC 27167 / PCC 6312) TaxID=195253 RepID=UPI00029F183E|nr:cobalt-precorrin-5B (C(1))-methyltransferase CbiD [Synechococcus sp. PCC 6312]AFY61982.1 cobalamin biosynthesis protein CbiD [Synechococcus sp. PCC 6312]
MSSLSSQSGYTLPVFACAAAVAALRWLQTQQPDASVTLELINPDQCVEIPIQQVAGLGSEMSLAITHSNPGANLDLTRDTPIWGLVQWAGAKQKETIKIQGGEGIGINQATGESAIYSYAQQLLLHNLQKVLGQDQKIFVTIILPEGRALAERTSNPAFGIVSGLSLLGTSGISQALSAPEQLDIFRQELLQKAQTSKQLVFCIGENGLDLATKAGIPPELQVKTANWLGPLLVEAGLQGVNSLVLWGYHGKLIKLAGGIFHTHHHLADARQEILTAHCAQLGLTGAPLQAIFQAPTIEAAYQILEELTLSTQVPWTTQVFTQITNAIEARAQAYIYNHTSVQVQVGCVLFNRQRQLFAWGEQGRAIHTQVLG